MARQLSSRTLSGHASLFDSLDETRTVMECVMTTASGATP